MTDAPQAPRPKNSIVFFGDTEKPYYDRENDIHDHNFKQVRLDGDESIYYVYAEVNQGGHDTPKSVQMVTKTNYVDLTFKHPRSCKGFSKEGIILFETFNYGGESQNFNGGGSVKDTFPIHDRKGVSSFQVIDGTWELLGEDGGKIVVNGQTQFGPGTKENMPFPSDKVASIKRIR